MSADQLKLRQYLSTLSWSMTELANEFSGASILSSSSYDFKFPPSSIIDGEYSTFWLTTGSFPQEIIIQLGEPSLIKGVEVVSCGIRSVELGKCEGPQANMWDAICTAESAESDSEVQRIQLQAPPRVTAQYLRVKILSGWADYVSVFKVSVLGTAKR